MPLRNSRRAYILSILWREPWSLININPVGRLNVHPNSAESETYLSCKIRDCVLVGVLFTLFLRPSWSTCNLNPRPCFQIRVTRKHLTGHVELVVKRENEPLRADDLQRIVILHVLGIELQCRSSGRNAVSPKALTTTRERSATSGASRRTCGSSGTKSAAGRRCTRKTTSASISGERLTPAPFFLLGPLSSLDILYV